MKLISWNVNGMRAVVNKGFYDFFDTIDADVFCIQETKMQEGQLEINKEGYHMYMNSAIKKGYSGTMVFSKIKPLSVTYGMGKEEHDQEGRVITCEYDNFYLVNVYVPNSKEQLARLSYRIQWEEDFRNYLMELDKKKPVIMCGDLNVAHEEIDLKNPNSNHHNAGFSDEERQALSQLLDSGFIDSFRYLYPNKIEYSWWSYRFHARANNAGWRIDYFIVSNQMKDKIKDAKIYGDVFGSDHCPVLLEMDL